RKAVKHTGITTCHMYWCQLFEGIQNTAGRSVFIGKFGWIIQIIWNGLICPEGIKFIVFVYIVFDQLTFGAVSRLWLGVWLGLVLFTGKYGKSDQRNRCPASQLL